MGNLAIKNQGIVLRIGTQAADPAGDTFTEIKEVTSIGEAGPEAPSIDATALTDTARHKLKGIPDYGEVPISGNRAPTDAGQTALNAAAKSTSDDPYNFEIEFSDMPSGGSNNTKISFKALVLSFKTESGDVDGLVSFASSLAITGATTEVIAA
jgi:hypothetical protein